MIFARWLDAANPYINARVTLMTLLGFSSGLPWALTGATLTYWLSVSDVSLTHIGLFALVWLPHCLKFLWAPLIDYACIPFLSPMLGRKRAWAIFSQTGLIISLILLGQTNPSENLLLTAAWAMVASTFSATQDVALDAIRVDILSKKELGFGSACISFGHKLGILASGAGALYLTVIYDWSTIFAVMAFLVTLGMCAVLLLPEPKRIKPKPLNTKSLLKTVRTRSLAPLIEFFGRKHVLFIMFFILSYKMADILIEQVATPFYVQQGYSAVEIATAIKFFGFWTSILGGFIGGLINHKVGIYRNLWMCGIAHALSNSLFVVLAIVGYNIKLLYFAVAAESLTAGMSQTALLVFLASLCNRTFTASQYALFTSFVSLPRTLLASGSGWIAAQFGWISFFSFSILATIPGILLAFKLNRVKEEIATTKVA